MLSKLIGISSLRALGAILTFAFSVMIARMLDPGDAARMFWAIAATSLLGVLARGGLDKGFMKLGATCAPSHSYRQSVGQLLGVYALPIGGASLIMGLALWIYGAGFNDILLWETQLEGLAILCSAIIGISIANTAGTILIGAGANIVGTLLISVVPAATALLVVAACVALGTKPSLLAFATAYAAGWITSALLSLLLFTKRESDQSNENRVAPLQNESKWFALIGLSNTLEQWLPAIVAGMFLSANDAAGFALSARLVAVVQLLMVSATSVYASIYARTERAELFNTVKNATISICALGIPAIAVLYALAPFALRIFGNEYEASTHLLRILLLGQGVNLFLGTYSVALIMHHNASSAARIFTVSALMQMAVASVAATCGSSTVLAASSVAAICTHAGLSFYLVRKISKKD